MGNRKDIIIVYNCIDMCVIYIYIYIYIYKSLIAICRKIFATINKIFIFGGRLLSGLSFYGVKTLSWYFLISWDPGISGQ